MARRRRLNRRADRRRARAIGPRLVTCIGAVCVELNGNEGARRVATPEPPRRLAGACEPGLHQSKQPAVVLEADRAATRGAKTGYC